MLLGLAGSLWASAGTSQEFASVIRFPVTASVSGDFDQRFLRVLQDAESRGATAIILEIDVWQGDLNATRNALGAIRSSGVTTYALVTGIALDVGALVALVADEVFMVPGSSIGGRTPGPDEPNDVELRVAKTGAMRREMQVLAEHRGFAPALGAAMADASVAIDGLIGPDEILSLTAEGATYLNVVNGIAEDADALLELKGLSDASMIAASEHGVTGATIEVRNNSWRDIRIYLVRGGARKRLGLVTSFGFEQFIVPYTEIGAGPPIRLLADPVGGDADYATEAIRTTSGLVIQWQLQNNLAQSSLFVHRP